ncbi:cadmium-translocating P-type ATPase [Steroidobacter sp. S1-65]|uniref:Cadmium-translocating P-type ATPase n=1 Tax=Steroidobacter gossypii TaxID=2805490 RepID=A0ABS1X4M6_9GAMM|nr:heavy metal translocating P-type ATPase [Steroidobacter gossypii]MBM0108171.1 cadmium-translocating P-type ATPase [Steroidobacter gossypii]
MNAHVTSCWHCGEPLPATDVVHAHIDGVQRSMCCHGCRAAAEWIEQLGLGDYYRLRTQGALKPAEDLQHHHAAWERFEVAQHVTRDLGDGRRETMLLIDGIRCAACVWLIERALCAAPGVTSVQVNAAAQRARVVWQEPTANLPQILHTLSRTGYRALPLDAQSLDDLRRRESRDALKRLLVAGFGMMQAMMYAAVLYLGGVDALEPATHELFRWLGFLVATPVVLYSAKPFFRGAVRSLRAHQLGMDVPVSLAIGLIYCASLVEALRGGAEVYFDSVSMFVFLLLAGRYLEMRARHRAGDLTDALARITPRFAQRQLADGKLERIGIHELRVGDRVHVSEGGIVPADGVLTNDSCRVDEALLSGESVPVSKQRGDLLIAGSVLVDGTAQLDLKRVGADTELAGIATLVGRAQAERPKLAQAGERAAARFVARVLSLTTLTIVGWSFVDPSRAFSAALAVLVVSCPCAFALAVPAAITRALSVLARRGVLVVKPDAVEALAGASHVVFDKTGTLTEPQLALANIETFDGVPRETALRLAASLARLSVHPAARAIAAAYDDTRFETVADMRSQAGLGISGTVGGRELRLGRADFAAPGVAGRDSSCDEAVVLADDAGPIAMFRLSERLRPNARAMIDTLQGLGLEVAIASGGAEAKVAEIATRLGVREWRARQLPTDKLAWLQALRANGARVIAIGDGVNDAPVLAGADVAIALGSGAELARATSDIVLAGERLDSLPEARAIACQALTILEQNQRWTLFYNLAAMPLAALGFVPPWLAAIGMSLSSLCVILNALRIGHRSATRDTAATVGAPPIASNVSAA